MKERTYNWKVNMFFFRPTIPVSDPHWQSMGTVTYRSVHDHTTAWCCNQCFRVWLKCVSTDHERQTPRHVGIVRGSTCPLCGPGVIINENRPAWWTEDLPRFPPELIRFEFPRVLERVLAKQ